MIGTEDEAKAGWWCPEARVGQRWLRVSMVVEDLTAISVNRDSEDRPLARCLASGCAMWRWFGYRTDEGRGVLLPPGHDAPAEADRVGYCGAGGPP